MLLIMFKPPTSIRHLSWDLKTSVVSLAVWVRRREQLWVPLEAPQVCSVPRKHVIIIICRKVHITVITITLMTSMWASVCQRDLGSCDNVTRPSPSGPVHLSALSSLLDSSVSWWSVTASSATVTYCICSICATPLIVLHCSTIQRVISLYATIWM